MPILQMKNYIDNGKAQPLRTKAIPVPFEKVKATMKVIIAIDEMTGCNEILDAVIKTEWPEDTQFKVLTVCAESASSQSCSSSSKTRRKERKLSTMCREYRTLLEKKVPQFRTHVDIRKGSAPEQIVTAASEWMADKILVGQHKTDCKHCVWGSVAEVVALSANCPVELVKAKQFVVDSKAC